MTEQLFPFSYAMSPFICYRKHKQNSICKCHLPQINVDKIVCTVSSLRGIQMLIAAQKHGIYWLVLETKAMHGACLHTRSRWDEMVGDPKRDAKTCWAETETLSQCCPTFLTLRATFIISRLPVGRMHFSG